MDDAGVDTDCRPGVGGLRLPHWRPLCDNLIEINLHYSSARPFDIQVLLIKTNIFQMLPIKSEWKRYLDCIIIMISLREV